MGVNSIARLRPGRGPESMVSERKEKVFIFDYFLFYGNLKIVLSDIFLGKLLKLIRSLFRI